MPEVLFVGIFLAARPTNAPLLPSISRSSVTVVTRDYTLSTIVRDPGAGSPQSPRRFITSGIHSVSARGRSSLPFRQSIAKHPTPS